MKNFLIKNYILITNIVMSILLLCLIYCFRPTVVNGESMSPILEDGDTLICNTLNKTPEIGDIVVIKPSFETVPDQFIIKRVTDIKNGEIFIEGDNKENSYDSRNFGYVSLEHLLGVVIKWQKRRG